MAKLSICEDSLHVERFEHLHLRQQSPLYFVCHALDERNRAIRENNL